MYHKLCGSWYNHIKGLKGKYWLWKLPEISFEKLSLITYSLIILASCHEID